MVERLRKSEKSRKPATILFPQPAYPFTARQLFAGLRALLASQTQHPISFERLAGIIGQPTSTTHYWFEIFDHPHVLAFMALLERLPQARRQAFIEGHCRPFPNLDHARLAHRPEQVTRLKELLNQESGLTFIVGGTDDQRTFLLTALGHSVFQSQPLRLAPAGIDVHQPANFVPVSSVTYINPAQSVDQIRSVVLECWPRVMTGAAPLLLFNGVWHLVKTLRGEIVSRSRQRYVVIAEDKIPDTTGYKASLPASVSVLRVSGQEGTTAPIRVECERLKPGSNTSGLK